MDEMLPDEIRVIRDSVNRFMETEVNPVMDGFEGRGEFPRDLVKKAGGTPAFTAASFRNPSAVPISVMSRRRWSARNWRAMTCGSPPATTNRDRPVRNASTRAARWSRS